MTTNFQMRMHGIIIAAGSAFAMVVGAKMIWGIAGVLLVTGFVGFVIGLLGFTLAAAVALFSRPKYQAEEPRVLQC